MEKVFKMQLLLLSHMIIQKLHVISDRHLIKGTGTYSSEVYVTCTIVSVKVSKGFWVGGGGIWYHDIMKMDNQILEM